MDKTSSNEIIHLRLVPQTESEQKLKQPAIAIYLKSAPSLGYPHTQSLSDLFLAMFQHNAGVQVGTQPFFELFDDGLLDWS